MKKFFYRCSVLLMAAALLTASAAAESTTPAVPAGAEVQESMLPSEDDTVTELSGTETGAEMSSPSSEAESGSASADSTSSKEEQKEEENYNPNITLSVQYDYDGKVRGSFYIPAFIEIENKGREIDGELRLIITNPQGYDKSAVEYKMQVNVEEGGTASYVLPFKAAATNNIQLFLYENDKAIAKAPIKKSGVEQTNSALVGVLSDNFTDVTYLKSMTSLNVWGMESPTSAVELTAEDFPENTMMMERFGIIILNRYDINLLSDIQRETLISWVKNGGTLISDADSANKQAVQSLSSLVEGITVQEDVPAQGVTEELFKIANISYNGQKEIPKLGSIQPAGTSIYNAGETPLLIRYEAGKGRVFLTTFSLSEPALSSKGFASGFFSDVEGISALNFKDIEMQYYNNGSYLTGAVTSIEWLDAASVGWILILGVIFILIAAPISYIILAKKDKRDWIWFIAPALGIVFCAVIIISGYKNHGNTPVSSIVNVIDDRNGYMKAYSEVGIGAVKGGEHNIELDGAYAPEAVDYMGYYGGYFDDGTGYGQLEPGVPTISFDVGGQTKAEMLNLPRWNMKSFKVNREMPLEGELQVEIILLKGGMKYKVKNETGTDLTDVTIPTPTGYARLKHLAAGEEAAGDIEPYPGLSQNSTSSGTASAVITSNGTVAMPSPATPNGYVDIWGLTSILYGGPNGASYVYGGQVDAEEDTRTVEEKREDYLKSSVMEQILNNTNNGGGYYGPSIAATNPLAHQVYPVWAWTDDIELMDIQVNGKPAVNKQNVTLVITDTGYSFGEGEEIYIPDGFIMGTVSKSELERGYANKGETYCSIGKGSVEFQLDMPENIGDFNLDDLKITLQEGGRNCDLFIKNAENGEWLPYKVRTKADQEILDTCVNSDNKIELKLEIKEEKIKPDYEEYVYGFSVELEGRAK